MMLSGLSKMVPISSRGCSAYSVASCIMAQPINITTGCLNKFLNRCQLPEAASGMKFLINIDFLAIYGVQLMRKF